MVHSIKMTNTHDIEYYDGGDDFSNIVDVVFFPLVLFFSLIVHRLVQRISSFNITGKICDYCAPATAAFTEKKKKANIMRVRAMERKRKRKFISKYLCMQSLHISHIIPSVWMLDSFIENLLHTI